MNISKQFNYRLLINIGNTLI
ncbi:MAG: hypothetical protein RLZZ66_1739, partial [Pseudomonadota bacterium]